MVRLEGNVLIDVVNIARYGTSFRHCWVKGAVMCLKGNKIYFANEARTALMIYKTRDESFDFGDMQIHTEMIPETVGELKIDRFGDKIIMEYPAGAITKRITFDNGKDVSQNVQDSFAKFWRPTEQSVMITSNVFNSLSPTIGITELEFQGGEFKVKQTTPTGDTKVDNIFDMKKQRGKGSMLKFQPIQIPDVDLNVRVATEELKNLSILSPQINFGVGESHQPLVGEIEMYGGSVAFMISSFMKSEELAEYAKQLEEIGPATGEEEISDVEDVEVFEPEEEEPEEPIYDAEKIAKVREILDKNGVQYFAVGWNSVDIHEETQVPEAVLQELKTLGFIVERMR